MEIRHPVTELTQCSYGYCETPVEEGGMIEVLVLTGLVMGLAAIRLFPWKLVVGFPMEVGDHGLRKKIGSQDG